MTSSTDVHEERTVAAASGARQRWTRIGLTLVVATLLYNVVEAVIATWFGAEADIASTWDFEASPRWVGQARPGRWPEVYAPKR